MASTILHTLLAKMKNLDMETELFSQQLIQSEETSDLMTELNQQQMEKGERADESEILPPYTEFTVKEKKKKGQIYDWVTLRDTGAHYDGMRVAHRGGVSDIYSTDWKSEMLQEKYGANIYGLQFDNLQKVRVFILPDLYDFTKRFLKIK